MTAVSVPTPTQTAGRVGTALTIGGRTTLKLLRTPQVFGIAVVQSIVFLLMFRYVLGGAIGVERRHLRGVPRPRIRGVGPALHRWRIRGRRRRRRVVGALRPLPVAAHLRYVGARRTGAWPTPY